MISIALCECWDLSSLCCAAILLVCISLYSIILTTTTELLPRAIREWEINRLAFEKDTEPYAILRDKQIISMAMELDIEVICPVSHTLYDLDQLAGPSKTFPLTYNAFCNLIKRAGDPLKPLPPPALGDFPIMKKGEDVGEKGKDEEEDEQEHKKKITRKEGGKGKNKEKEKEDEGSLDVYGIPTLQELGYPPIPEDKPTPWKGGETEALRRMIAYLKDKAKVFAIIQYRYIQDLS